MLFRSLSIRKVGLIGAHLASLTIIMFAAIVINQEYVNYKNEIHQITRSQNSFLQKEIIIEQKKQLYKTKIMRYVIGIGSISLFMYFTIFGIAMVISNIIETEIDSFIISFEEAIDGLKEIDEHDFTFKELQSIIHKANSLILDVKLKQKELTKLNKSLENKVKAKTIKLQNLIHAQDEFVKKSIHEINTPLSIIMANIDLLKMHNINNKQFGNIESASKIITNIFNDLSYIVQQNKVRYTKQLINLSYFLLSRIEFFEEVAQANSVYFEHTITPNLHTEFNEVQLMRIIDNNISNAIKYSYQKMPIVIQLRQKKEKILFTIISISGKINDVQNIFEPYYREHSSRGGFGLGLKIVKEICDENKINIEVISKKDRNQFSYQFNKA